MEKTEYRALRRVEEVDSCENRSLFRVVLEPDDDTHLIVCTFETHPELHDRVRCVTPLSYVRQDTNETVTLDKEAQDTAMTKLINYLVETDEDLQDSLPAW